MYQTVLSVKGRSLKALVADGVVKDVHIWSTTSVSGSSHGGGGYLHEGSGQIYAPSISISSRSWTNVRVTLVLDNGSETHFTCGEDFTVSQGNVLTLKYLYPDGRNTALVQADNHNTGQMLKWPLDSYVPTNTISLVLLTSALLVGLAFVFAAPQLEPLVFREGPLQLDACGESWKLVPAFKSREDCIARAATERSPQWIEWRDRYAKGNADRRNEWEAGRTKRQNFVGYGFGGLSAVVLLIAAGINRSIWKRRFRAELRRVLGSLPPVSQAFQG